MTTMKKTFTKVIAYRAVNIYAFIFTFVILTYAGYAQLHDHLMPCPLCILQRVLFAVLAVLYLFGALYIARIRGRRILFGFIFIVAILGIATAARHIYLQHLPTGFTLSCGPGLSFILKNLSPHDALRVILTGSGDCALVNWHFFYLTMPEWSLICFIVLALISIWQFFRQII